MQIFHYISTLFFAGYFVLAGTGYNVINYCCNYCEKAGIEYVVHHSCQEVHYDDASCCDHGDAHAEDQREAKNGFQFPNLPVTGEGCFDDKHCEIQRVNLSEFVTFSGSLTTSVPEVALIKVFFVSSYLKDIPNKHLVRQFFPPPEILASTGRDILTTKQVLII